MTVGVYLADRQPTLAVHPEIVCGSCRFPDRMSNSTNTTMSNSTNTTISTITTLGTGTLPGKTSPVCFLVWFVVVGVGVVVVVVVVLLLLL